MKTFSLMSALICVLLVSSAADAAEKPLFGPKKFDVLERYGKANVYQETFAASEEVYLIKVQNGDGSVKPSDWVQLSINGAPVLPNDKYAYPFVAVFVKLQKENTFELNLRDDRPSGFRRPPPIPKSVFISIVPAPNKTIQGAFGVPFWEGLKDQLGLIGQIKGRDSAGLAVSAVDLRTGTDARAAAMRKLTELKDASAQPFMLAVFVDPREKADVRGEAALGLGLLGDASSAPALMRGVLDPEEKVRLGSARALSFFKEEETADALRKTLETLDLMRRDAVIRTISDSGWKPVGVMMELAESSQASSANMAIRILGSMGERRVGDLLLKLLENPGPKSVPAIITALGEIKEMRAVEPLLALARDPAKRAGMEAELGAALADLGDQRAVGPIEEMIKKAQTRLVYDRLRAAYQKLTGKEYK